MTDTEIIFFNRYTPKLGDVVVELGSAEGSETMELSALVGSCGIVIAVEAHLLTFQKLRASVNGQSNVKLIESAVIGAKKAQLAQPAQEVRITNYPNPWHNRLATDIEISNNGSQAGIKVSALTLDSIADGVPRIDFLKINIEGSEADVLAYSPKTLEKTYNITVSCHDFMGMPTKDAVRSILEQANFDVRTHNDPFVIEDGHNGRCLGDYLYAEKKEKEVTNTK